MIQIIAAPSFQRKAKKIDEPVRRELNKAIKSIAKDPLIGEPKIGDLKGCFVYKFKIGSDEMLIAYRNVSEDCVKLLFFGPHENFYRDLKRLPK